MLDRLGPPAAGSIAALEPHTSNGSAGDLMTAAAKSTPPLAVSASAAAGVPLNAWVMLLTAAYLVLQIAYLIWKWHRDATRPGSG